MTPPPHAVRLFPGGGADDTGATREWARETPGAWQRAGGRPRRSRTDRGRPYPAALARVLRARAARTPVLPTPIPGAAHLRTTYGTAHTPDGLCLWVTAHRAD